MPIEAPSIATEILLLEKRAEEIALIRKAAANNRLTVVTECPDILDFLRRQGRYSDAPRPDLILLDLELSQIAECDMLTELKKDPQFRRIPVIVLASSEKHEDVLHAYNLHANAYICKPADQQEFVKIVRATLHFWLSLVRLPRQ